MLTMTNLLMCGLATLGIMMAQQTLSAVHQTNTIDGIQTSMGYKKEQKEKMFVIGLAVETSNKRFLQDTSPLRERIFRENLVEQIPNRINSDILVVYTDYQGDYTQPFTYLIGCEVKNLNAIPEEMRGVEIKAAPYAVFTAKGEFPQSLISTWQAIWNSSLNRSYTTDFEIYRSDFNPQANPEINVYIAIDES